MTPRIIVIILSALMSLSAFASVSTAALTTEMAVSPLGVENLSPRLSWKINSDHNNVNQTSYHILVASSPELLESSVGDVWDSGVVKSDKSTYIDYSGTPLKPATRYWWKVNVATNKGKCGWSESAMFQTGFPDGENSWGAEWIGGELPGDIPMEAVPPAILENHLRLNKVQSNMQAYILSGWVFTKHILMGIDLVTAYCFRLPLSIFNQ